MRRHRRRPKLIIPVASMADIAFQLIIFFMVCSNFAREAGIPVKPPTAADIERVRECTLVVTIDAQGQLYFQGRRVYGAGSVETEVGELVRNARTPEGRRVLFRCDRSVGREVFEPVMDAISRGGGTIVAVGEKSGGGSTRRTKETPYGD